MFYLCGMEPSDQLLTIEQLSAGQLADFINDLIERDFSRLIQLLYRLDVSEEKLKSVLIENPTGDAGMMMAQIIMARIAQREKTKDMFKQDGEIPDAEKW